MKFSSELTLAGFVPRVENNGPSAKEEAITIKFTGTVPADDCKGLFATEVAFDTIVDRFYRKDGELVTPDLGAIELTTEGVGVKAKIKSGLNGTMEFSERVNIDAITLKLNAGRMVDLKLNLHVHPTDEQIATVYRLQKQGVTLSASWKKTRAEEESEQAEKQAKLDLKAKKKGGAEEEEEEAESAE
jgi:hypothetical protein